MTEIGLLIAQVAFLLLLFGFIWLVVRGSLRSLEGRRQASAPAPVEAPPPKPEREVATPAIPAPPPAPTPEPQPVIPPAEPVVPPVAEAAPEAPADGSTGAFDLSRDVAPRLVVESGAGLAAGEEVTLEGGLTIGRAGGSDLRLDDEFASHTHARIVRRGQYFFITDLGSTNGTFLNDRRIEDDAQLRVRDVIRLGDTRLRYEE